VTEAHAQSVMCAYNSVDGVPACANTMLLRDHLREAWKFSGYVVSDCAPSPTSTPDTTTPRTWPTRQPLPLNPAPISNAVTGRGMRSGAR